MIREKPVYDSTLETFDYLISGGSSKFHISGWRLIAGICPVYRYKPEAALDIFAYGMYQYR